MTKRLSDSQRLYKAVMDSPARDTLRKLPAKARRRFHNQLEGLQVPANGRREFEGAFAAFVARQTDSLVADIEFLERVLGSVPEMASVCNRSSKPVEYMRFLARGLKRNKWVESMGFFAGDRKPDFQPVSADDSTSLGRIESLAADGSEESIRELIEIFHGIQERIDSIERERDGINPYEDTGSYRASLAVAAYTGEWELVRGIFTEDNHQIDDVEELSNILWYEHEREGQGIYLASLILQKSRAERVFTIGDTRVYLSDGKPRRYLGAAFNNQDIEIVLDSEATIQHELQHIFDLLCEGHFRFESDDGGVDAEKRAYLAAWAFVSDEDAFCELSEYWTDKSFGILSRIVNGKPPTVHDQAIEIVDDMLEDFSDDFETAKIKAMELLNEEYRGLTGLTYDEILEPFRK